MLDLFTDIRAMASHTLVLPQIPKGGKKTTKQTQLTNLEGQYEGMDTNSLSLIN